MARLSYQKMKSFSFDSPAPRKDHLSIGPRNQTQIHRSPENTETNKTHQPPSSSNAPKIRCCKKGSDGCCPRLQDQSSVFLQIHSIRTSFPLSRRSPLRHLSLSLPFSPFSSSLIPPADALRSISFFFPFLSSAPRRSPSSSPTPSSSLYRRRPPESGFQHSPQVLSSEER